MTAQRDDEVVAQLVKQARRQRLHIILCLIFLAGVIAFYGVSWALHH
jgi:hypothetical protein